MKKTTTNTRKQRKKLTMVGVVNGMINLAPLMTSTPPAMLVLTKTHDLLGFYWWQAGMSAAAVEFIGLLAMVMRQKIQRHNKTYKAEKAQVQTWPTVVVYALYLVLVIFISVGLELGWPRVWVSVCFALLSLPGTWLMALNYRVEEIQAEYREKRVKREETRGESKGNARETRGKPAELPEISGTLQRVYEETRRNPKATQKEIAETLEISRQLVGRYQQRLKDMGYSLEGTG